MTLYEFIVKAIESETIIVGIGTANKLFIDLDNKEVRKKNKYLIREGVIQMETILLETGEEFVIGKNNIFPTDIRWETILEHLYHRYKYSCPSSMKDNVFKALTSDEMTDEELENGANRWNSLLALKLAIVLGNISGVIKWENPKHWFWISKNEPDLILYRKWF